MYHHPDLKYLRCVHKIPCILKDSTLQNKKAPMNKGYRFAVHSTIGLYIQGKTLNMEPNCYV